MSINQEKSPRDKLIEKINRMVKLINENKINNPFIIELIQNFQKYDQETEMYISDLELQIEDMSYKQEFYNEDKSELLRSVCGLTGIAIKYLRTKGIQIK